MGTRKQRLTTPNHNQLLEFADRKSEYSVIGDPCSFYLWRKLEGQRGAASNCITGRTANDVLSRLRQLRVEDKAEFIQAFNQLYEEHKR